MIAIISKRCTKCGQVKPWFDFYVNKAATGQLKSRCKACWADLMLAKQGIARKRPYGEGGIYRKKERKYCTICKGDMPHGRRSSVCRACAKLNKVRAICDAYGTVQWHQALTQLAIGTRKASEWDRCLAVLVISGVSQRRSKCEKARRIKTGWTWRERCVAMARHARSLAKRSDQPQIERDWWRLFNSMARNWRRKQAPRKVTFYNEGNSWSVTIAPGATEVQMRFDW